MTTAAVPLDDDLQALLAGGAVCYLATVMPDGSPQVTQTWVDTDGEHVLINTVAGFVKTRNVERDPRVALTVSSPATPSRYVQVRGTVVEQRRDGAVDHIEKLAQRYLGGPYPWWGGRDQTRVVLVIRPEHVRGEG